MQVDEALESALIQRSTRGDPQAIEALLSMHSPFIRMLIRRVDPTFSLEEDLFQAGYIGLMSAIRRFDPSQGTHLLTYAYPWIIGEIRRTMREKQKHANTVSIDDRVDRDGHTFSECIIGDSDIDFLKLEIQSALSSLAEDERILIILRYFRDKSQVETARLLKRSQAQISRIERRALDKLGALLG